MRVSPAMLEYALAATQFTGAGRLIGRRYRGVGSIFIGHSVVLDRRDYLLDELRTGARYLEAIIDRLLAEGTDIVSLDEAIGRLHMTRPRPFACFTFDDGYRDNLTVALQIFQRQRLPFTVFVTTAMIDRTIHHWWSGIAEIVKAHDLVEADETAARYPCATFADKVSTYRELKRAVETSALSPAGLAALFRSYGISLPEIIDRDALSEAELRKLAASPLVEIGAHTTTHPHLRRLAAADALREMQDNKAWLESLLQRPVRHFAYPFGGPQSCGAREAALARRAGFSSAVTTRLGNILPAHREHLTAVPRLRLFSEYEDLRLIDFQRSGVLSALLTRFGSPAVTV